MTKKQKNKLIRIVVALAIYILVNVIMSVQIDAAPWLQEFPAKLVIFLIHYAVIGWDIVYDAIRNIARGQVFDENFLMFIATVGAFAVSEYTEAVAVMLFYQVGEWFQDYAVNRSRQSIAELMDICPEYANIETETGIERVDPDDVELGSIVVVMAGERIPLDGIVTDGESLLDTSSLTGESVPRMVRPGSEVVSGCVNGNGVLHIKTTKEFEDSTVAKILELVENASSKKAKVENFITRFARYYTPVVVILAVALALIPSILMGNWAVWLKRACIFLVISCPCALVISVPLSFFGGIGAASRAGILVKGSNFLESVSKLDTVVFDKTGTLTKGEFVIQQINTAGVQENVLVELVALAESYSTHPVADAIRKYYESAGGEYDLSRVTDCEEISGHGVLACIDGRRIAVGNSKLMDKEQIVYEHSKAAGTVVYAAIDGVYAGCIVIADTVKSESKEAVKSLKAMGVRHTAMLTGDRKRVAEAVAEEIGIDIVCADLLPVDKVSRVEELLKEVNMHDSKGMLAFVGDGINDAPVLTRADIGIAMGSMGSDAAIEAADIVLMDDDVSKIAKVVMIGRKTMAIVRQNIVFALGVKGVILVLGALGMANMWAAVFADVGVSVIAILNAMRVLRIK